MLAFLPALLALAPQTVHVKPSNVRLVAQDKVTAPPAELVKSLKLSTFYAKYLDAEGFPILSSKNVPDAAFFECKRVLHGLFLKSPEARDQMVKNHVRLVIIGKDEVTTDVPEYKFLKNDKKTNWDTRARGLGATRQVPVVSCAEENVLAYPSDRYKGESILVHEFCHAIMDTGLVDLHPDFLPTLQKSTTTTKKPASGKTPTPSPTSTSSGPNPAKTGSTPTKPPIPPTEFTTKSAPATPSKPTTRRCTTSSANTCPPTGSTSPPHQAGKATNRHPATAKSPRHDSECTTPRTTGTPPE